MRQTKNQDAGSQDAEAEKKKVSRPRKKGLVTKQPIWGLWLKLSIETSHYKTYFGGRGNRAITQNTMGQGHVLVRQRRKMPVRTVRDLFFTYIHTHTQTQT